MMALWVRKRNIGTRVRVCHLVCDMATAKHGRFASLPMYTIEHAGQLTEFRMENK